MNLASDYKPIQSYMRLPVHMDLASDYEPFQSYMRLPMIILNHIYCASSYRDNHLLLIDI